MIKVSRHTKKVNKLFKGLKAYGIQLKGYLDPILKIVKKINLTSNNLLKQNKLSIIASNSRQARFYARQKHWIKNKFQKNYYNGRMLSNLDQLKQLFIYSKN